MNLTAKMFRKTIFTTIKFRSKLLTQESIDRISISVLDKSEVFISPDSKDTVSSLSQVDSTVITIVVDLENKLETYISIILCRFHNFKFANQNLYFWWSKDASSLYVT